MRWSLREETREIFKDNKDVGGCKAAEKQSNTCTDSKVTISADMATFSRDLAQYLALSEDDSTVYVALQEACAVAVFDLDTETITSIKPLQAK